ncbi:Bug family tripartite tricarboxylate transporter substrate binding protein [Bordetella holmesii]|uniref:Tripartite tricarboxylate transporter family receptor n=2 Tax=Bordetella holmesii TaxID=35814 RepID=A0A158M1F1_9BORD|nr:tripartite tricarboxylate transporter substrate binding protein [Bordetella holmesii]AHV92034.1 tripartite tricarboxylate transporter receptor family protein [Bordetella holmesii ATCC 51541]AIT27231.1 tripartite tricarboxylate transporter receptor family protein [Bordetella holmesii 44057]EWM44177.1 tripartite tricarboxylate transporter receptor family protein [Bordetella holmesii 41130]EWM47813.1 tripartite tricarboxylate transporter receptor family protein [Bordetella holmesii 35009]EWM51
MFRSTLTFCLAALLAAGAGSPAVADTYPTRPIKVISPFPAGGATDVLTRILAERMGKDLKQTLIVENKAGAGTSIGASYVSREQPDGYTILMATNSTLVTNRFLYKDLPYDPDGFAPIGLVGIGPLVLLSSPKQPFKSTRELVAYAKNHPGKLTFASFGPGTSSHLAGELFKDQAGIDILHVPFKGATQALPALISGDVDVFFDMVATGMPQAKAGKINVFGITSKARLPSEPALATLAEQGWPTFDMSAWFSFVAPKGTPPDVLARLQQALQTTLSDETVRAKMLDMGIDPRSGSAADLQAQIRNEQPLVQQLIKQANIALQ